MRVRRKLLTINKNRPVILLVFLLALGTSIRLLKTHESPLVLPIANLEQPTQLTESEIDLRAFNRHMTSIPATRDIFAPAINPSLLTTQRPSPEPLTVNLNKVDPTPQTFSPALPFKYVGKIASQSKIIIYLDEAGADVYVKEGEVIDGLYKLKKIDDEALDFEYLPTRTSLSLSVK